MPVHGTQAAASRDSVDESSRRRCEPECSRRRTGSSTDHRRRGGSSSLDRWRRSSGPAGRLAAALPAFEPRAEQLELATGGGRSARLGEHLLAEAGTGTGKSLAYLLPALASGKRVVVATATKALQQQLLTKDVPAAAVALDRPVDCVASQGPGELPLPAAARRPRAARRLGGGAVPDGGGRGAVRGAARLDRDDGDGRSCRAAVRAQQNVAVGRARSRRRPVSRAPALPRADDLLLGGRHASGRTRGARDHEPRALPRRRCRPVAWRRAGLDVLPDHDAVVFDEAHRLEDAALPGSAAGCRSPASVGWPATSSARPENGARPAPATPARRDRDARSRPPRLAGGSTRSRTTRLPGRRRRALDDVVALAAASGPARRDAAGQRGGGDALARRALGTARRPRDVLRASIPTASRGPSRAPSPGRPSTSPAVLRDALWDRDVTAVLVSATLEPDFLARRLGLDDARGCDALFAVRLRGAGAALRAGATARAALARLLRTTRRGGSRALPALARPRARAHDLLPRARGGRDACRAGARVPGPVPGRRARESGCSSSSGTRSTRCSSRRPRSGRASTCAGEALSLLVIDKLPFAPPDDPLVQARCERIDGRGR